MSGVHAVARAGGRISIFVRDGLAAGVDLELPGQHDDERKALARCSQLLNADPSLDGRVYYHRELYVDVTLVDPVEEPPVVAPPPAPPPPDYDVGSGTLPDGTPIPPEGLKLREFLLGLADQDPDPADVRTVTGWDDLLEWLIAEHGGDWLITGIDQYNAAKGKYERLGFEWLGLVVIWKWLNIRARFFGLGGGDGS